MNHEGTQLLETNRLVLRKYDSSDADDMYRNWVTDPEVCRFWQWEPHKDMEETKTLLAGWIQEYAKTDYYHWTIVLKSTSQAIGYIYLADINDTDNSLSVHYALSREYWGRGITTEACKCVIHFAFLVLGAGRVFSYHHTDNPASGRVMQKSGMRYIKTEYKHFPECDRISGDYHYYEIMSDVDSLRSGDE